MHVAVYITAKDKKEARKIASLLLNERLIACANITDIESMYWWKNKIEDHGEALLIAKTRQEHVKKIIETVKKNHSYTAPCVNAIQIIEGNPDYLMWVDEETKNEV